MRCVILLVSTAMAACQGGGGSDVAPIDGATGPEVDGGVLIDALPSTPDASSSDDAAPSADAPTVTATTPADSATGVAPDVDLTATFSSDLDPASVTASTFLVTRDGQPVAGTVGATARTATFAPAAPLTLDGAYTATITTGVTGATGVALETATTWSFSVRDGAWTAATQIDDVGPGDAASPKAAADDLGNVTVVWPETQEVYAARFQAGDGWSDGVHLSTEDGSASDPVVAAASSGEVQVVWTQERTDHADVVARGFTGGAWSATATLDPDEVHHAELPDVAFAGAGDAMAVWSRWNGDGHEVWASHLGAAWSTPTRLSDVAGEIYDRHPPRIAGGDDGGFTVMFGRGSNPQTWFSRYVAGTGWGTTAQVPLTQDLYAFVGDLGVDHGGTLTTTWSRHPDGVEGYIDAVQLVAGVWSQERLDTADGAGESAFSGNVAVAPSGEVVATWLQSDGGGPGHAELWASRFVPGGGWSAPVLISDPGYDVWASDVAIADDGRAFAVWTEETTYIPQVHAASQPSGGAWRDGVQLSTGSRSGQPSVTADRTGAATAVWWQVETAGGPGAIWAARFE